MPVSSRREFRGCCKRLVCPKRVQQQKDDSQTSSVEMIRPKKNDQETQVSSKSLSTDKIDLEPKISEKSSETYFDGNNQNISSTDNNTCPSNSAKSSQGVVKCPCSLVCKTVGVQQAPNFQKPQFVQTIKHKCTCQNFNLPSSSSSNSIICDQFPVKIKLSSEDRYAYLRSIRNMQSELNATSFRPERLQPNVFQIKMNSDEEFYSCSSSDASEDTDVLTECPCYSQPFKDKNLVILELLHEVVHLINDDNPIRKEAMRITNTTPTSLNIKSSKPKYQEICDPNPCPFCNQEMVCGPVPTFPSAGPAFQQIPEPFIYEDSFKDCFSSVGSCICNKINDVCPRHGPLKILLNKLQCQTEKESQQYPFDGEDTPTKSSFSTRSNARECTPVSYVPESFYINGPDSAKSALSPVLFPPESSYPSGPDSTKSAHSPVPYPPHCSHLNRSGSVKSSRSTKSNQPECSSARSPVPYPPECSYLNRPGSTKSSRSAKSNPPECFYLTKSTFSPTTYPPESEDEELQSRYGDNFLTFGGNEPGVAECSKDVAAKVQESVEDFRVYKPCQDCLMEYDDEEPWPCLPAQMSTIKAEIEKQTEDVKKLFTPEEIKDIVKKEPKVKLEEGQDKEPSIKHEESQERKPDIKFTESIKKEKLDELEEKIKQESSDDELHKPSSQVFEEINKKLEQDNSESDTKTEKLEISEEFSLGESKTGTVSDYYAEEFDDENELEKEKIAESLKTKEQQEEDDGDNNDIKTSDRSLPSTKQIASTSEVDERKEREDDNRDAENNNKYSDTTVATTKRSENEDSTNEMKYFIDSLITDLNAMDHARRRSQFEKNVCKKYEFCARESFPVTITNVSDLGANSLYVQWKIHDCFGIGGYEIYTDGYLTNRYYNSRHDAAVITNVDVTVPHKIALVAQSCANDESIDLICNMNRDKNKPKQLQWKSDEEKRRESYSCLWTPSIFLYDPNTCKATASAH